MSFDWIYDGVDMSIRDYLYEAAGIDPTFEVKPIESFVGREATSEILKRLPVRKGHRALQDALALFSAVTN